MVLFPKYFEMNFITDKYLSRKVNIDCPKHENLACADFANIYRISCKNTQPE